MNNNFQNVSIFVGLQCLHTNSFYILVSVPFFLSLIHTFLATCFILDDSNTQKIENNDGFNQFQLQFRKRSKHTVFEGNKEQWQKKLVTMKSNRFVMHAEKAYLPCKSLSIILTNWLNFFLETKQNELFE